jgi:Ni,Fe-hydrogenase III large subunit/NADH:ubiquinone oxidoreductase subunit C
MKTTRSYIRLKNGSQIPTSEIPILSYDDFKSQLTNLLQDVEQAHCSQYFAIPKGEGFQLIMIIAQDVEHEFFIFSHYIASKEQALESLTSKIEALHIFEREIHENFDIQFLNHPWLKPVRYAHNRADRSKTIGNYPFYKFDSTELHEVSVGPIHAGIIEPGHFRFSCHGETVKHLEIQLGWQHRGIEALMLQKTSNLQRTILSESITGDTAIGHALSFVHAMESLATIEVDSNLIIERSIALELERLAIHTGDLSGVCTDVAYQLGSSVFNALRTPIINFTQSWCGNRFGKGLIRIGGTHYPLSLELKAELISVLDAFETRFVEMAEKTFSLPSIIKRFEGIGIISKTNVGLLGCVGMVAKTVGLKRDIRASHPFAYYKTIVLEPKTCESGDVMARAFLRYQEAIQSIKLIRTMINTHQDSLSSKKPNYNTKLQANKFVVSATEGWRGEIVHSAKTDSDGKLSWYKIKDPSMHNWKAMELSLRNLEISDFPINNKSYDLSYSGHDL